MFYFCPQLNDFSPVPVAFESSAFFPYPFTRYCKFDAITDMADMYSLPYTGVIDRPDLQVYAHVVSCSILIYHTCDN